jgi:hypothetical protein
LVSDIQGGIQTEGILRAGSEENVWIYEGVAGGWRRLHNEELYNMYASPTIIRVSKSRMVRWVGHVRWMG